MFKSFYLWPFIFAYSVVSIFQGGDGGGGGKAQLGGGDMGGGGKAQFVGSVLAFHFDPGLGQVWPIPVSSHHS